MPVIDPRQNSSRWEAGRSSFTRSSMVGDPEACCCSALPLSIALDAGVAMVVDIVFVATKGFASPTSLSCALQALPMRCGVRTERLFMCVTAAQA